MNKYKKLIFYIKCFFMFVIFQFFKKFIITVIPLIRFSETNVTALLAIKLTLFDINSGEC